MGLELYSSAITPNTEDNCCDLLENFPFDLDTLKLYVYMHVCIFVVFFKH